MNAQSRNTGDFKEYAEGMAQLRFRITDLEGDKLRIQNQKNDIATELERANRHRVHLEEQIEKLKVEMMRTKSDVETGNFAQ